MANRSRTFSIVGIIVLILALGIAGQYTRQLLTWNSVNLYTQEMEELRITLVTIKGEASTFSLKEELSKSVFSEAMSKVRFLSYNRPEPPIATWIVLTPVVDGVCSDSYVLRPTSTDISAYRELFEKLQDWTLGAAEVEMPDLDIITSFEVCEE